MPLAFEEQKVGARSKSLIRIHRFLSVNQSVVDELNCKGLVMQSNLKEMQGNFLEVGFCVSFPYADSCRDLYKS